MAIAFSRTARAIESLEQRVLLSVTQQGDTLLITGDDASQIVEIRESPELGTQTLVRFDANGNGNFTDPGDSELTYDNVRHYVIQLNGGNDALTFYQWRSITNQPRSLTVDLGSGHDTFYYTMREAGVLYSYLDGTQMDLSINAGTGDDQVALDIGGLNNATLNLTLDMGAGNDLAKLNFLYRIAGTVAATVLLGEGNDTFDLYFDVEDLFSMPAGQLDVNAFGGPGDDILTAISHSGWRTTNIAGVLRVGLFGEAGTDYVFGSLQQMTGDFAVVTDTSELSARPGLPAATISGRVYWIDPAAAFPFNIHGLEGWTVYLDTNADGQLTAGEPSAITDAGGMYSFVLPTHGIYTVRVVLPPGWTTQTEAHHVDTLANPTSATNDFIAAPLPAGPGNPGQPAADNPQFITGTAGNDVIEIKFATWTDGAGQTQPGVLAIINGIAQSVSAATHLIVQALAGDDLVIVDANVAARVDLHGGDGNDTLHGGNVGAEIFGGDGHDLISGGDGNDTIYGNFGSDTIYAGAGNDEVRGGIGRDVIFGGAGDDTLIGGNGMDSIYAGAGNDYVEGKGKADVLFGGIGNDTLISGAGSDYLDGGDGDDLLIGNDHPNFLVTILGGPGHDRYFAGPTATLLDVEEFVLP